MPIRLQAIPRPVIRTRMDVDIPPIPDFFHSRLYWVFQLVYDGEGSVSAGSRGVIRRPSRQDGLANWSRHAGP